MSNRKIQTRVSPYVDNQLKMFANAHTLKVSEWVRYIFTRFFDDYERETGGKNNGK